MSVKAASLMVPPFMFLFDFIEGGWGWVSDTIDAYLGMVVLTGDHGRMWSLMFLFMATTSFRTEKRELALLVLKDLREVSVVESSKLYTVGGFVTSCQTLSKFKRFARSGERSEAPTATRRYVNPAALWFESLTVETFRILHLEMRIGN
jgi:hypothetical protein